MTQILIAALVYIVGTFPLAYAWHLTVFKERYHALKIYRDDVIPLFGLSAMAIQGVLFGMIYVWTIAPMEAGWLAKAAIYAAFGGFLSWSFTTIATVAKSPMTSRSEYFAMETGFTAIQWILVAVITALVVG